MVWFKKGEIVTVSGGEKRWCVESLGEGFDKDGEAVQVANLSDVDGKTRTANTDLLTKVAG